MRKEVLIDAHQEKLKKFGGLATKEVLNSKKDAGTLSEQLIQLQREVAGLADV